MRSAYKEVSPEAAVYRLVNTRTGKALLGSTTNLSSLRNKLSFARSTKSAGVLDQRLRHDLHEYGIDAFALEVLEPLATLPEMTDAEILADLATLEALWREKYDPAPLY